MSKMRVPEMDVVRFKESDVIVASGAKTMTISNFGDRINLNGRFTFGSFSYTNRDVHNNFESFKSDFNSYFGANIQYRNQIVFDFDNAISYDLSYLVRREVVDSAANNICNGTYSWDGVKFNRQ